MLCDKCGKNEANIHIETTVNGIQKKENLCSECAQGNVMQGFNFGNLLSGMVKEERNEIVHCSNCGMTVEEFEKIGKFGCANCYKDLRSEIQPVLKRIHGSTQYCGYEQTEEDKQRLVIQDLKAKLSESVLKEDYEQAAELRDKIKLLEEGETDDSLD